MSNNDRIVFRKKLRQAGNSVALTLPVVVLESFKWKKGDDIQIVPLQDGSVKLTKIESRPEPSIPVEDQQAEEGKAKAQGGVE